MARLVIDPNVLVSAAITEGTCADLLRLVEATADVDVVLCPRLVSEFEGVLRRDRFRRYLPVEDVERHVVALGGLGTFAPDPRPLGPIACRDADDAYLIALARETGADAIVSGDRDLSTLVDVHPPVLTPARAFDRYGANVSLDLVARTLDPPGRALGPGGRRSDPPTLHRIPERPGPRAPVQNDPDEAASARRAPSFPSLGL